MILPPPHIISEAVSLISYYHNEKDVLANIHKKYESINWINMNIVLCGFSPYARKLVDSLKEDIRLNGKISIVDVEVHSNIYNGIPIKSFNDMSEYDMDKSLFIICSNPYMGLFINLLKKLNAGNIITYHLLNVCDDKYDYNLERYNAWIVKDRITHFLENREYYIDFLENLGDEESKEILSKLILYVFTLDATYCDVKSIHPPYFGFENLPLNTYNCFIDLGGFNGDTLRDFLSLKHNFDEYWYFEPDEDLFKEAKKISSDQRVRYNNLAIGSKVGDVLFSKTPDLSSVGFITDTGNTVVKMDTLDNFLSKDGLPRINITCIKMDVEGSEYDVLLGAKKIISVHHPVLMISIEHKTDDIKKLSEYIKSLFDRYVFYIRCCAESILTDLTMYAIPRSKIND